MTDTTNTAKAEPCLTFKRKIVKTTSMLSISSSSRPAGDDGGQNQASAPGESP